MNEETDATDIPGDTGIAILCASAEAFNGCGVVAAIV
jgi:hypothetical protein